MITTTSTGQSASSTTISRCGKTLSTNACGSIEGTSRVERQLKIYELAEHCEYSDMTKELIRDRLVVSIQDTALSEKLQMDSGLTLEAAKKAIRQREAVHKQQWTLNEGSKATADLGAVRPTNIQLLEYSNEKTISAIMHSKATENAAAAAENNTRSEANVLQKRLSAITADIKDTTAQSVASGKFHRSKTTTTPNRRFSTQK